MKKISLYLLLATVVSVVSSCKKDDIVPTNSTASVYTDEQNKENLQNTGLSMMKEMDASKNLVSSGYERAAIDSEIGIYTDYGSGAKTFFHSLVFKGDLGIELTNLITSITLTSLEMLLLLSSI